MSDLTPAFVRTLVPIVIGPLAARFFPGVDIRDPDLLLVVSAVVGYIYYVLVRVIETKYPRVGYFLGIAKAPAYSKESAPSPGPGEDVEAVVVPEGGEGGAGTSEDAALEPEHVPSAEDELLEPELDDAPRIRTVPLSEVRSAARKAPAKAPIKRVPVKRATKRLPPK